MRTCYSGFNNLMVLSGCGQSHSHARLIAVNAYLNPTSTKRPMDVAFYRLADKVVLPLMVRRAADKNAEVLAESKRCH